MEAADVRFTQGLRYISAAARCRSWAGDAKAEGQLAKLADSYSKRGTALMIGEVGATPLATDSIAPQVRRGVHAAPRGEGC